MPRAATVKSSPEPGLGSRNVIRKTKTGMVVSDHMDKTAVVRVDSIATHPLYKKRVRKSRKFMVHDETNLAHRGDFVRIVESRPTSKCKSWELGEVLRAAGARAVAESMEQQIEAEDRSVDQQIEGEGES